MANDTIVMVLGGVGCGLDDNNSRKEIWQEIVEGDYNDDRMMGGDEFIKFLG